MDLPSHQLTMTVLMTPDTANFAGNVHGGTLLKLLETPFEDHAGHEAYAGFPPDWASTIEISCSS